MFSFKKFRTPNQDLMQLQNNIADAFQIFGNSFIFDGVLLKGVTIGTTDTIIPHMLDRVPLGYFPSGQNALAELMQVSKNGNNLTLKASTSVKLDLWVF